MEETKKNQPDTLVNPEEEKKIYTRASRRAGFKIHFVIYLLVNVFFWIVWFFLFKGKEDNTFFNAVLFLSLVWFIAIVAHYLFVYKWNKTIVEKEIKKLKKEMQRQEAELAKLKEKRDKTV